MTDQICSDKLLFSSIKNLSQSHSLNLPNVQSLQAFQFGYELIHNTIKLHKFFYVPEFRLNLISVAELTTQLKI